VLYSPKLVDYVRTDERGLAATGRSGAYLMQGAATRPSGVGLVLLYVQWGDQPYDSPTDGSSMLRAAVLLPDGHGFGDLPLGVVRARATAQIVTSKAAGLVFVVGDFVREGRQLVALAADDRGLGELWRVPVARSIQLFADAEARAAHALVTMAEGAALHCLTGERPAFATLAADSAPALPDIELPAAVGLVVRSVAPPEAASARGARACAWPSSTVTDRAEAYRDVAPLLREPEHRQRIDELLATESDVVTLLALVRSGLVRPSEPALTHRLAATHGHEPWARLMLAEGHLHAGEAAQALGVLAAEPLALADAPVVQHAAHLRALCLLALGQDDAARNALHAGSAAEAHACPLAPLADWLEALAASRTRLAGFADTETCGAFLHCVRSADEHLEAGRWEAALDVLDRASTWRERDAQGMARLATAWLQLRATNGIEDARKRRALAEFAEGATAPGWRRRRLGSTSWSDERLAELLRDARAWLGDAARAVVGASSTAETGCSDSARNPALALAGVDGLADPADVRGMLPRTESSRVFDRHIAGLLAQAEAQWDRGNRIRLAGLVLDAELPGAAHLAAAGEQLLGLVQPGPEVALAVPLAAVLRRLARWSPRLATFLAAPVLHGPFSRFPLVLVRRDAVGFGNVTP
jgi:hypothetical protein